MRTLIIIPTYNETDTLQRLIAEACSVLPETDILVIDDNSADGTAGLVKELSKKNQRIKLIQRAKKLGLGSAYIQGFKYALANNYDFIFEMDADLSHSPRYLREFLAHTCKYNLIIGSRYVKGGGTTQWELWRRLLSYAANLYARVLLSLPYHDLTSGFKCYCRKVLEDLNLDSIIGEGYVFQIETTYRTHLKGYRIKEIPIVFKGRRQGKTKISRKICFEAIWKVPLLRLKQPFMELT